MNSTADEIRATVKERFAAVAQAPGREKKFPVGPASAKALGYDPGEIDALPGRRPNRSAASATRSA